MNEKDYNTWSSSMCMLSEFGEKKWIHVWLSLLLLIELLPSQYKIGLKRRKISVLETGSLECSVKMPENSRNHTVDL